MDRDQLRALRATANVAAFLQVIYAGETNHTQDAYRMVNGGALFDAPPWKHPYEGLKTTQGGKAAGAPQFIPTTWGRLVQQYGFTDFSPENQDLGAVALIVGRNAMEDVLAGRVGAAIDKLAQEWVSLPGLRARAPAIFQQYGGTLAGQTTTAAPKEKSMPAPLLLAIPTLIQTFGPALAQLIPQVAKLFSSGSEVATRNVAAAEAVFDTVIKASGEKNIQSAIEAMKVDPALTATVQQAVVTDPVIMGLLEVGGGVVAARESALKMQMADKPFWFNPVFWITMLFTPLIYWIVGSVLIGGYELPADAPWWAHMLLGLFGTAFTAETRAGIINIVIGMVLGAIMGLWFGTSYGSQKKDDTIANQSKGTQ